MIGSSLSLLLSCRGVSANSLNSLRFYLYHRRLIPLELVGLLTSTMLPLRSVFLCFLALSLTNASAFSSRFAVVSKGSRHHHVAVAAAAAAQRRRSPAVWKILRGGAQEEEEEESRSTSTSSTIDETPPSATTTTSTTAATVLVLPKQLTKITTACASIGKLYLQQLQQNPIVTKSITAGFIFGLSDVLAQKIDQAPEKEEKQKFNWTRLTGM